MRLRTRWVDFDFISWGVILTLMGLGFLTIYSATVDSQGLRYVHRQALALGVGLVTVIFILWVPYERWLSLAFVLYASAMALLALTLLVGRTIAGSQSWLAFGGFHLQTAELAKWATILMWARLYGSRHPERLRSFRLRFWDLILTTGVAAFPATLIILQPDYGTALTFGFPLVCLWFLLRMPVRYWLGMGLAVVLVMSIAWGALKPYHRARVLAFLNPETADPRGVGYQVLQSKIALGAGGMWGKGFHRGAQTLLGFVPERHTDFVMTSFGEEWGFVGVTVVFLLFMVLFSRWITLALRTPDPAGRLIIALTMAFWGFHFIVNTGVVIGWLPVTGLPLPLMSYGGSFLLFCLMSAALVQNVYWRRHEFMNRWF